MQPWTPPENTIVLTDLLRSQPQPPPRKNAVYVKPEPEFVSSRPLLLPPRAPMLPAISDVFRTTSPQQQQRYQYESQENAMNLPRAASPATTSYAPLALPCPVEAATYSATFMTRPNATDYNGLVLPSLPPTSSPYAAISGHMTPPGLVGAKTRPIGTPSAAATRPASRTCRFAGCSHYVVDHGLCVRHGGGKRCTTEGCSSRAKHFGRCWKHGGSVECKAPGCSNRAKSRGYCWSHGGGTKCKTGGCDKIAISNGLCWAHGGGKRCIVPGCRKQAYERTCNYCNSHFQQYQQTALELARHQPPLN
ncbi:hypothetical protein PHYPSEUDO_011425 [Phytophthora pseudosyringae]|uniref:WRKY19-like zinc finger domain-containing protein n=1 Tax=Phytophthora pseudosyringae TaxID=221518 RepID=A0A8T1VBF1_9STRA|nr:hypothetical protein PHYPSEUDO_011425 [Phytophthora pseudosyringae]